jgi:ADP-ribose pyrophosphatase
MDSKLKKISPLAETKFLSLYDAEYTNKMGDLKHWIITSRKNKETLNAQMFDGKEEKIDAVVIAAMHKSLKKLVLVKQFRVPVNGYIYELPAGLIDGNESISSALERELREETGLKLTSIDTSKKTLPIYVSAGMTDESIALAYCLCEGEPSLEFLEEDEDLEVVLVSQDEAKELLNKEVKFDVKAYMILQSFVVLGDKLFDFGSTGSL